MLTLQQQAHHFAHRMAMCQPLAPKQTATIPKPSFVYLANGEIYPEPHQVPSVIKGRLEMAEEKHEGNVLA